MSSVEISSTGYWRAHDAHLHHVCCQPLAKWIASRLSYDKEKPVYDFGCGLGYYLSILQDEGFTNLSGFDGDPAEKRIFQNINKQDLSLPFTVPAPGHCIFLEVAEHIPAKYEHIFLKNIADACDGFLITSWAVRGQGGHGHVNELNNDEVIPKFNNLGFKYCEKTSAELRSLDLRSAPWFQKTLMFFEKSRNVVS